MRVGIVNDVPLAVEALRRALAPHPEYHVAWTAANGAEAVALCLRDRPDLVLMDLIMPVMDGVEATKRIMAEAPCAVLVVTAHVGTNAAKVFEAMGHGALDAVDTPVLGTSASSAGAAPLLRKIELIGRLLGGDQDRRRGPKAARPPGAGSTSQQLLAIGASAGGPAALAEVLRGLPAAFPAAVVVVQHIDEQFAAGLAEWLHQHSRLPVRLASEGDVLATGTVLLAGRDDHLALIGPGKVGYTPHPRDCPYRPSVDVFFASLVAHWRGRAVGLLLTGMGRDGAIGLKALRKAGHHTIAQDQTTSAVYGMPKAAVALGAAVEVLPLGKIAPALLTHFQFTA